MDKKKALLLSMLVIFIGVAVAGGTFAWFNSQVVVSDGNYSGVTDCFLIDYNINNDDNTQDITGTLFPSSGPLRPGTLGGKVSMKINNNCTISGEGTLKMQINSGTGAVFGTTVAAHCENPTTLETLNDYKTSSDCTSHSGSWVTNGTALKYAIYEDDTTGDPVSVGYVTSSMIGANTPVHTGFSVTKTERVFYIYLWLDGYNSDNTYNNVPFSGNINAYAKQTAGNLPSEYQQVEYIQSSGAQYIITDVIPSSNFKVEADVYTPSGAGSQPTFAGVGDTKSIQYYFDSTGKPGVWTNAGAVKNSTALYNQKVHYIATTTSSGTTLNINGTNYTSSYVYPGGSSRYLMLFAYNGTGGPNYYYTGRIYSLSLYSNNNLIRSYVPCYDKESQAIGLYEIVNGTFLTNKGSGNFTKGSNVNY